MQRQGRKRQETIVQPWGRVLVPPQGIHTTISWAVLQILKPLPVGEVNCVPPTSTQSPDGLEPEGWWCRLPVTSPPANQKNVHKLITPSLSHYYKTPHYPLQVGTHSSEGISPLWPLLPGKATKLFFSTSPKTLSLKINSVSGYRGWIRLHEQVKSTENYLCDLFP